MKEETIKVTDFQDEFSQFVIRQSLKRKEALNKKLAELKKELSGLNSNLEFAQRSKSVRSLMSVEWAVKFEFFKCRFYIFTIVFGVLLQFGIGWAIAVSAILIAAVTYKTWVFPAHGMNSKKSYEDLIDEMFKCM